LPPLKDIYDKLKTTIVGTRTSDVDTKLDNAVKDIVSFRTNVGRNGYIDLIRNLISKSGVGDLSQNMFQQGTTPAAMGQGGRLLRYKTYESIVANINYCFRALNVIIDNVLSPDDITKISLDIKPKNFLEDENETNPQVKQIREIITRIKLEEKLETVVKGALEFGDFFCEIADSKTALTSKAYLTEYVQTYNKKNRNLEILEAISEDKKNLKIVMDYSPLAEDTKPKEKSIENLDLHLLFYEPKRVVKLQSDLYPVCFGYLVFPLTTVAPQLMLQNQLVNNACTQILKSLQKKLPEMPSDQINQRDLKDIISTMVKETDFARAMNIRYVPPDKMQHFQVPSTKYYPYGESIFDPCQFTAKVLIALETALTIHRLNRSTEKRKIAIEIGLSRDARKAIESLKEEFRKRKVNLDSFGTVDTIPSMINTFEDVYIPQKDGKPFVDISTFNEGGVDIRGKTDELKFLRDQLVASLGVPASFLNIEENLSNKSALSEENILFARTIIRHQKYLGHQVKELVQKVYKLVDPDKYFEVLDNVLIGFAPPKSLQFERESKYMSDLANLVETLERIGIPREWSKKRYLSNIDWNEVKKYEIDTKIDQTLNTQPGTSMGDMGAGGFAATGMVGGAMPGVPGGGGMIEPGGGGTPGGF
jgi:hypothetical protein